MSSILFDTAVDEILQRTEEPPYFTDLNLDQIVGSIVAEREEYQLRPWFYSPLPHPEAIGYRQAVFRDLEDRRLVGSLSQFAAHLKSMRGALEAAGKFWHVRQKQRGFLEAVSSYCAAVNLLARELLPAALRSRALSRFRESLAAYQQSEGFRTLEAETQQLKHELRGIEYRLQIEGPRIAVSRYESDPDYATVVLRTFEKFRQGAVRDYSFRVTASAQMNHVEGAILDRVARLYPVIFSALEHYCGRHRDFLDALIARFDREIQFYLGYLAYIEGLKRSGLAFCYPEVTRTFADIDCQEAFDLALAVKLSRVPALPVTNDVRLCGEERILVVSGANQGGKTTFARMFGQLHYLAALGCPVPGRAAKLFLFDDLFTHFEREEDVTTLTSKLEEDLVRIHAALERATSRSLLVMNESFGSSTLQDALYLSREVLRQIIDRGLVCLFVTFLDELASLGPCTVSLVATVRQDDPAQRTFKVVRRPADGLAYALAIAAKHGLTYERVRERLQA